MIHVNCISQMGTCKPYIVIAILPERRLIVSWQRFGQT